MLFQDDLLNMHPVLKHILLISSTAGVAVHGGCQKHAVFEAEAALRPGAIYTGPDISTFNQPVESLTIGQIAAELRAMVQANHVFANLASLNDQHDQSTQLRSIDMAHTQRLSAVLDIVGWPTEHVFGHEAALAAFIIVQHATHDPEFQQRCLTLMHARIDSGHVSPQRFAMLTDRLAIQAGLDQVYGSQVRLLPNTQGEMIAQESAPIADRQALDERRESLGLDPWQHYCRKVADTAQRVRTPRFDLSR